MSEPNLAVPVRFWAGPYDGEAYAMESPPDRFAVPDSVGEYINQGLMSHGRGSPYLRYTWQETGQRDPAEEAP